MFRNLNQMIDQWLALEQKSQGARLEPWSYSQTNQYPKINLFEQENKVVLTAEIPGLNKADIELKVQGDQLSISATPPVNEEPPEAYLYRERGFTKFSRDIRFDFNIDAEQVEAQYEDGVLSVTVVAEASEQPKTIALA